MHVSSSNNGGKRAMNFELNLVPFIDVLSCCICFLLVTAVFINLGAFHVNQAVGNERANNNLKPTGTVTVYFGDNGLIRLDIQDVRLRRGESSRVTIPGVNGEVDYKRVEAWIKNFSANHQEVKTVLFMPNQSSKYDEVIQLMAQFKGASMDQIGIAPL